MNVPEEFKNIRTTAANGVELQMINEAEDANFMFWGIMSNEYEITTVLEKATGDRFMLLNDNYAKSCGWPDLDTMMVSDEVMDNLIRIRDNMGGWQFITEGEIKKGGKDNG